jgi:alkanesulfonate monooxygenase SsuD/methylene tetrahydromethanopterin reductase-like flavin-dependent oxidoreductase (luciferase family)
MTVIVGRGEAEARKKYEVYRAHISVGGALALLSGWTGVDFSTYDPDEPIRHIENDAGRTAIDNLTRADPDRVWTVRTIAEHVGIGGVGPVIVGSPQQVADELEHWVAATDVDGFNLAYAVMPETFIDVVDLLVPELQRRGRYKADYQPGTLREKLFGSGRARLGGEHPAARHRQRGAVRAANEDGP